MKSPNSYTWAGLAGLTFTLWLVTSLSPTAHVVTAADVSIPKVQHVEFTHVLVGGSSVQVFTAQPGERIIITDFWCTQVGGGGMATLRMSRTIPNGGITLHQWKVPDEASMGHSFATGLVFDQGEGMWIINDSPNSGARLIITGVKTRPV